MADSRIPGTIGATTSPLAVPARTPGPLGKNDAADPTVTARLGDTPGSLGVKDHADPSLPPASAKGDVSPAKLPDGTPVAPGSDGKMTPLVCPASLAKRADGSKTDVDWSFISAREGGQVLTGYVPDASGSKSGVTIGTGIDLGQRAASDIDALDISADLKKTLKPYCGKTKKDATDYLKKNPLTITAADATSLDKAVKQPQLDKLIAAYDDAVDKANTADHCSRAHFNDLPQGVQTALASANFQYGSLPSATPNYWKQITEQRWQDASDNLKKFGDAYPTRRKLEAELLDAAIAAAAPPPGTK
jgi:Bacterial toxin homologue of phage lysozyme, C-term